MWKNGAWAMLSLYEFISVCIQGVTESNKENTPDQKISSRKREALHTQQEEEEPTKKNCV